MAAAPGTEMKRTLTMTGLTINAMALIAPGAFLWTTFQAQVVQQNAGSTTAFDMVPGLLFVLVLAFLTAFSYAELSNIYPDAGAGSSYYFAEAAFLQKEEAVHYKFARLAKFIVGWVSHLYYWIYPGIMVAFTATLLVYILAPVRHHAEHAAGDRRGFRLLGDGGSDRLSRHLRLHDDGHRHQRHPAHRPRRLRAPGDRLPGHSPRPAVRPLGTWLRWSCRTTSPTSSSRAPSRSCSWSASNP